MEKNELLKIIGEKYNEISKIEDEIKELLINFGSLNSKFKQGDKIRSDTFSNDNIILQCTGESDYSFQSDNIFVNCEVITSNDQNVKIGTIFSIPEKYLKN